ncbi:SIS domain-containing protein, partial [Candidatus Woesearchaeota archaeon]|nr:SIS domain-containing protein [Candidatus Woesearchaeota archaeon]
ELKHGPIALISETMPTFAICPESGTYEKTFSNIQEIKARQGKIIALATEGDEKIRKISDDVLFLPRTDEILTPLLAILPLQLFAYHLAAARGCDIDRPRNLAKSVTVE